MHCLVTGGAGFIGTHLCEYLVAQGHRVTAIDNLSVTADNVPFLKSIGVKVHVVDISDFESIKPLFNNIDIVFHLAAMNRAQRSIKDPLTANKWNVTGTINCLEAARRANVKKFVNISSSSVYAGLHNQLLKEDMALRPPHPYGVGKLIGEHYTRLYEELYGLKTVTLRYFSVYGPRQRGDIEHAAVIAKFIHNILKGELLEIYGDGNQTRNFTYVEDVVKLTAKAGFSDVSNDIFNVAGDQSVTINKIVEIIQKVTGRKAQVIYTKPLKGDPLANPADISKTQKVFSYKPQISIEEGIKRTVEWYLRYLDEKNAE